MIDLGKVILRTPEELALDALILAEDRLSGKAIDVVKALATHAANRKILLRRVLGWMYAAQLLGTTIQPDILEDIERELTGQNYVDQKH